MSTIGHTKLGDENRMSSVAFHVIGALVKVTNSWDVVFPVGGWNEGKRHRQKT